MKIDQKKQLVILEEEYEASLFICFLLFIFGSFVITSHSNSTFLSGHFNGYIARGTSRAATQISWLNNKIQKSLIYYLNSLLVCDLWTKLDFLDSRAHSLSTATNMSMMMGGFLTLCVSYTPVQMVSSYSILNQKYNFSLNIKSPLCRIYGDMQFDIGNVFISVWNLYYFTIQCDTILSDMARYKMIR